MDSFRRSQFIVPFGVGAIHTLKGGITVITAGLDYWFTNNLQAELADISQPNFNEFRLTEDKRFIRRLGIDHLMQPPEYRVARRGQETTDLSNFFLPVPVFRFPNWHICPSCSTMMNVASGTSGRVKCASCESKMGVSQTRFIVACENGCVMDFPWREWVFRKNNIALSPLERNAKLKYIGGNSVNDITVKAYDSSNKEIAKRTLLGAFGSKAGPDGLKTNLSDRLLSGSDERYTCPGCQPWLTATKKNKCGADLQPTLISATNAYFSEIKTSIYIPTDEIAPKDSSLSELYDIIYKPGSISSKIDTLQSMDLDLDAEAIARSILKSHSKELENYTLHDITATIASDVRPAVTTTSTSSHSAENECETSTETDDETRYRYDEYQILSIGGSDRKDLKIREVDSTFKSADLKNKISKVMCIERLKETRALVGFSRIVSERPDSSASKESLLRLSEPQPNNHWLPATEVYGEGLFIQFSEEALNKWESLDAVLNSAKSLQKEYDKLDRKEKEVSPRFLLIHTFAHILMTQMVFDCGYSSASLRERLYVSTDDKTKMAGVLIYTAAGDSDGTLGGLIRLGRTDLLEPMILTALEKATWCSSDPVCAEAEFQGTDNCNKAACHNCAIISETSCEEFNRFLDRSLVVNNSNEKNIGFFKL